MSLYYKMTILLLVAVSCFFIGSLDAQCVMCKMPAESNLSNGGDAGRGLNVGILYILLTPYVVVGTLAFLWWKNRRSRKYEGLEEG